MKKIILILFLVIGISVQGQNGLFGIVSSSQTTSINPNIVSNGTFDDGTNWNVTAPWTISGGLLNGNSGSTLVTNTPVSNPVNGETYVCTGTITNYVAGNFAVRVGGTNSSNIGANGDFSVEVISGADGTIRIDGTTPAFDGEIDNLEIRLK